MALQVQLSSGDATSSDVDVLAVCVVEGPLDRQPAVAALDEAFDGALLEHAKGADFRGKADQVLDLPTFGRISAKRVLLVGLGPKRGVTPSRLRVASGVVGRAAGTSGSLAMALPDKATGPALREVAEGVVFGAYRFTKYFTGDRRPKRQLSSVSLYKSRGKPTAAERRAVSVGVSVAEAICAARDAVNEPANTLTPEELANRCKQIARRGRMKITVLDKRGIAKAGMKLHYAVGQGSANEPRFIHMVYKPKRAKARVAFVGKGLTFDSGGICIKPAPGMGEMKADMGGSAAVLGLMGAVAAVKPNVEVHGIIGAAENMPDAASYRPGDVFGSLDGKSVEIINTDAEGRLVLADALAFACQQKPDYIIDAATLTGACVVALGKTCSAFYTGDASLAKRFDRAAADAGEAFWRMPLLEELRDQLKSDIADLKHTGDRWGGSISAALFLREFVGDIPWIHCDIAGPAWSDRAKGVVPKGGTGHAALTFLKLIESV